jgi:hypothetical protein
MKQTHPWLRKLFYAGFLLSFIAAIQLFVFSEQTEKYFAWTIQSPLTAATFGGFYFGTMTFGFLSGRETAWARVRGPALGLFAFLSITLAATLLHLDKFHFESQNGFTLTVAWVWVLIYVILPPVQFILLILQTHVQGADFKRSYNMPVWILVLLTAHGAAGIIFGLLLFFTPQSIAPFWPWVLTPLTSRIFSAWLISFGIVDLQSTWEKDRGNIRIMTIGYILFGTLPLIAMARYANEVRWSGFGSFIYLAYILSMLTIGIYGRFTHRPVRHK